MKLEQWQPAAADLSTAVKLGLDDALLRAERGRCYVKAASELATIVSAGATWQRLHPADGTDPAIDDEDLQLPCITKEPCMFLMGTMEVTETMQHHSLG